MKKLIVALLVALSMGMAQANVITGSDLSQFGDGWTIAGKVFKNGKITNLNDFFDISYVAEKTKGTITITNVSEYDLFGDYAYTLHVNSSNKSYLLDDITLKTGESITGHWTIDPDKHGRYDKFNQLVVYDRDIKIIDATPPTQDVPEPGTIPLLMVGMASLLAYRRKNK